MPDLNAGSLRANTSPSASLKFRISGGSALNERVLALGFRYFDRLAEHVRSLPYGRTADIADPFAVLQERRGTCSTKHRLLAAVAQDCGHSQVQLVVGIYEMSEDNTRGVEAVLGAAGLASIPEAHCYLSVDGERFDFTGLPPAASSPVASLLAEHVVSPSTLPQAKVALHKQAIAAWARTRGTSEESAWATREACIAALASGPVARNEPAGARVERTTG